MADLYNLLEDLNDQQDEVEHVDDGEDQQQQRLQQEGEENDNVEAAADYDEPIVPPALVEAERRRMEATIAQDDDHQEQHQAQLHDDFEMGEDQSSSSKLDVHYAHLQRLWTQERIAPELLPFGEAEQETLELQMELLQNQDASIDKLLSAETDSAIPHLMASIYKMDADRVRYMWTDLLRTRLHKIETHPVHMISMVENMTDDERMHLKGYGELLERHFHRTVLDSLPKERRQLNEPEMIDKPDMDEFVFYRTLERVEMQNSNEEDNYDDDEPREFERGSCVIARYSVVRPLVLEGKVELLL